MFAPARPLRVRVVGAATYFTQKALSALPGITLRTDTVSAPGLNPVPRAEQGDAAETADDVVMYEDVQPPALGTGNFVLMGAVPPDLPVRISGRLSRPAVTGWSRTDPLLASVSLAGLLIGSALRSSRVPGFRILAASGESPLVLAWDHAGLKALVFAFDPEGSDLPLRAGFPVLIANALSWFWPGWLAVQADEVQAGSAPVPVSP